MLNLTIRLTLFGMVDGKCERNNRACFCGEAETSKKILSDCCRPNSGCRYRSQEFRHIPTYTPGFCVASSFYPSNPTLLNAF